MEKAISNKHFSNLCKYFLNKITMNELRTNIHLNRYDICRSLFIFDIQVIHAKLLANYKRNDKAKSCVILDYNPFKTFVSYTFENDSNQRIKHRKPQNGDKLVFRLFFQKEKYKKKLISRWNVKIDWLNKDIVTEIKIENKLDEFHYHEAIDRTYSIMTMIDELLYSHPVIHQHSDLSKKIENIETSLYDVYNDIANKSDQIFHKDEQNIIPEN